MEASLPRECELADESFVASLWRLFGLVPRGRRRSRFLAAAPTQAARADLHEGGMMEN